MRVLGIDPGLRNMGWGVIDVVGSRISHIANGICHSEGDNLADRLLSLHDQLTHVLETYDPDAAAVEETFVNKDATGTLKLGQARGIALLVPAQAGLKIGEYAPNAVKKAVVGVGHAQKEQVQHMVRLQLPGVQLAGADAADALAIAICHAHHLQSAGHFEKALARAEIAARKARATTSPKAADKPAKRAAAVKAATNTAANTAVSTATNTAGKSDANTAGTAMDAATGAAAGGEAGAAVGVTKGKAARGKPAIVRRKAS